MGGFFLINQKVHCPSSNHPIFHSFHSFAQSTGVVEYTDFFSAEGLDYPNECPGYETKQSDGGIPVILEL